MGVYDDLATIAVNANSLYGARDDGSFGSVTRKGHGELIRENFGTRWSWLSADKLAVSAIGALLTEFVGVAGVGELFGISKWDTVPLAALLLVGIAFYDSYRRVEKIGVTIGLAELTFVIAVIMIRPNITQMVQGLVTIPSFKHDTLGLSAKDLPMHEK